MEGSFRGILIMNEGIRGELEKILDKIDQRISGHSRLHDRYKRRAIISEILLMGSAIILTISGLADDKYYAFLGLDPVFTRFCFSLYSIIALVIIIIAWKIDWRSIALTHGQAREKLSDLKLECRRALSDDSTPTERLEDLCKQCSIKQTEIEPIPENKFNTLKAWHLKKKELSKYTSNNAGKPYWLIWISFHLSKLFSKPKS